MSVVKQTKASVAVEEIALMSARSPSDLPTKSPDVSIATKTPGAKELTLEDLYQRYGGMVHAIILSRVPPQDAEDLLQDVFLAAHRRLSSLRSGEAVGAWLSTIARNRAADYWRRTKNASEMPIDLGEMSPPVAEANQVLKMIQELPEAYRETLIMRFVQGMTGPEIAEQKGMTHGSVRGNLHRGMTLLREAMGRDEA